MMQLERRLSTLELRAKGRKLEGYAALFGATARVGSFTEVIAAGAFSATLSAGRDVLALVDHDPSRLVGRRSSKTLRLSEDDKGLAFELDVPDTQTGRDVLALAERGDVGGASFGFTADREAWDGDKRTLEAVTLYEISVVLAWPAYEGTFVHARGRLLMAPNLTHAERVVRILEASQ